MNEISAFQDDKHNPFQFDAEPDKIAVLVHGFPGTPFEMRLLGKILQNQGYTSRGVLLPGFGKNIDQLDRMTKDKWLGFLTSELEQIRRNASELIIVGYSFGAALSINAISLNDEITPDKLILIAPFWNVFAQFNFIIRGFGSVIWPLVRLLGPNLPVYRGIDFDNEEDRKAIQAVFDDIDVDDPEVQDFIRSITIPFSVLDEVYRIGRSGKKHLKQITNVPILVLQGEDDLIVPPRATKNLIKEVNHLQYRELPDCDHEFIKPGKGNKRIIEDHITRFVRD